MGYTMNIKRILFAIVIILTCYSSVAQNWFTPMINQSGQFGPSSTNIIRTNVLAGTNISIQIGTNGEATINVIIATLPLVTNFDGVVITNKIFGTNYTYTTTTNVPTGLLSWEWATNVINNLILNNPNTNFNAINLTNQLFFGSNTNFALQLSNGFVTCFVSNTVAFIINTTNGAINFQGGTFTINSITGSTNDLVHFNTTNNAALSGIHSNHTAFFSNVVATPFGVEVGMAYRMFCITGSPAILITNTAIAVSILSNYTGTVTFPANFWKAGMRLNFSGNGILTTSATQTSFTNYIKLGSINIGTNTIPLTTSLINVPVNISYDIICLTIGGSGTFTCSGFLTYQNNVGSVGIPRFIFMTTDSVVIDTTTTEIFDIGWHTSSTANGLTIRSGQGIVYP